MSKFKKKYLNIYLYPLIGMTKIPEGFTNTFRESLEKNYSPAEKKEIIKSLKWAINQSVDIQKFDSEVTISSDIILKEIEHTLKLIEG